MRQIFICSLTLFFLTISFISNAYAEEKHVSAPRIEMLDDATMDKLVKLPEPSAPHQMLSSLIGTWYYTIKYWTKEGADAQISTGLITNEMILDGRFLSSKTSLLLNIGGQYIPYEGWGILGFDTIKNIYTSVWVDTMRTGMMTGTGKYNEQLKAIEEKGFFTHPLIKKEQAYRSELQFTSDDIHKRTVFITDKSGKEFKVLEIEFSRQR